MRDTKEILTCPVCGKEMKKIYSKEQNFNVDICIDGCGGMFFDNRELKKLDEQSENIDFILKEIEGKQYPQYQPKEKINCPCCNAVMVKNFTNPSHDIEIDECYCCGGIFLNSGELMKIRNECKSEEEKSKDFNSLFLRKFSEFIDADIQNRKI